MKTWRNFLFVFICLHLVSCDWGESEDQTIVPNLRTLQAHEKELVFSSSKFAIDLFDQLKKSEDPNYFFSPYSIHQALSMTMNGNEGEVLNEFLTLLNYEGMGLEEANKAAKELTQFLTDLDPKVQMAIANAIWYKQEFQVYPPFKDAVTDFYKAEVAGLDMFNPQSPNIINQWVESKTNGLIKDLIDQIPGNTVMYLVNAIYFKGDWKYRFQHSQTKKEMFHISPSQSVEVDMMEMEGASTYRYFVDDGVHYLEIPYSSGQFNMGILTTDDHNLDKAMERLTFNNLENWRENAQERNLVLKMPKFKMRYKMANMKDDLIAMGLEKPFVANPLNFTKLFDHPTDPMYINRVIHDAFIEVDEKGTEAAAATAVEVGLVSTGPHTPTAFVLDKPFVFFIQENHSGAILFMGKLGNPQLL